MQYSTLFLSALAATGALAVPTPQFGRDSSITVVLENQAIEVGSQTQFLDGMRQAKPPVGSSGPFATVELRLGPDVQKAGLRCQVLDKNNVPITVVRGANVDITFADGDKGLWTFQNGATEVSQIICDPAFVQAAKAPAAPAAGVPATGNMGGDTSIRVQLSDGNLATQTAFNQAGLVVEKQEPVGSDGPFNTVSLTLGADVKNQALRCKILDNRGRAIKVQRGQNIDITFADGGAGPWKFLDPATSEVSKIICDPAFVKASA